MAVRTFILLTALSMGSLVYANGAVDRGKLQGKWAAPDGAETWTFQGNGDLLKVTHMRGTEIIAGFECGTTGRECAVKEGGKKATVSMYFNGAKLVQLERQGDGVVKRRFAVSEPGGTLDVEIIPIYPSGKAETLHFTRAQASAGTQ